jgi:hypothetical protein
MSYIKILLVLAFCGLALSQTPPVFPDQYQIDFDETAKFLTTGTTKGTIYFDSKNNRELITRENGKFDRYCGSVYKTTDTPCNHYTVEGTHATTKANDSLTSLSRTIAASVAIVLTDAALWLQTGL